MNDPIFALATVPGNSAVAIIRISGEGIFGHLKNYFFPSYHKNIDFRRHHKQTILGEFRDNNKVLDEVILIPFVAPNSYSGEDLAEIHTHGNPTILKNIFTVLQKTGIRQSERGEFTKRAFLNNKINLTQAEAINDIISSKSTTAIQIALEVSQGRFYTWIINFKKNVIQLVAEATTELDFIDEDINFSSKESKLTSLKNLSKQLEAMLHDAKALEIYRDGIEVVLIGAPNTGKSSLLNYLCGTDRSLVSDIPGTTRDFLEITIQIEDMPVYFIDTAGIRLPKQLDDANSRIEQLGIQKTKEKIKTADVILLLVDASLPNKQGLPAIVLDTIKEIYTPKEIQQKVICLLNKADCLHDHWHKKKQVGLPTQHILYTSIYQDHSIKALQKKISSLIKQKNVSKDAILMNSRQVNIFEQIIQRLNQADILLRYDEPYELFVAELQSVLDLISELTGEVTTEDLLGEIFSRFCIGK